MADDVQTPLMASFVNESTSSDKWIARARPTFLYMIYIIILASLPFGAFYAFNPTAASSFIIGFKEWLDAIPKDMWWLFGAGYLGYGAYRTYDKKCSK